MALADLLASTQKYFVQNQNIGIGKSIVYTHTVSGLVENTFAFIGSVKDNHVAKDDISMRVEFANVFLAEEPKAKDTILYDGNLYSLDDKGWTKQDDLYLIQASISRHRGR